MIIVVEIYSVFVVWKAFNYITDYCMEKDYLWNLKLADLRRQHISVGGLVSLFGGGNQNSQEARRVCSFCGFMLEGISRAVSGGGLAARDISGMHRK